ncbi:MAG: hypothetical protein JO069_05750 [Verrucomicrobia bacterium]|nr:hypothetical protein [Verrucomicrobiota bacterium]
MSVTLESEPEAQSSGLSFHDLVFIVFRHKWKILLFTMAGLLAAGAIYFLSPPVYESEARLLVRYVVERSAVDALDGAVKTPGANDNLINSEVEILTSWDLAVQVAEAVGVERLVPGPGGQASKVEAARNILQGLTVNAPKDTSIISVSYRNADPELAVQVLQELVNRYFDKHLEVHRSVGAFDFVKRETDQVGARLSQTDEELKKLKAKAGITSLAESTAALNTALSKTQDELDTAQADLAQQRARVREIEKALYGVSSSSSQQAEGPPVAQPSGDVIQTYQSILTRVAHLRQIETEQLSKYTPESRAVRITQAQIADLETQRRDLEKKYPGLIATAPAATGPTQGRSDGTSVPRHDLISERAHLAEIEARIETLKARLDSLRERAKLLADLGPRISELERQKEVEEANYKYFSASLEKARIDETLDPARMPNISVVQRPSAAVKVTRDTKKLITALAVGGIALGLAIAAIIELLLDRTVKRPLELETRLRLPLLLSIPYFSRNGQLRLRANNADQDLVPAVSDSMGGSLAPWESGHFIRPFCEALRDHLLLYFQLNKLTAKPKLVAVTGLSRGAGASTVAAGLAATLSEMCDGKVLLVDKQFDPKRFYDLISEFRESDFEYVIFDLPSVSASTSTLAMSMFMDKVLLVVEAEKSNRDTVKRAFAQFATAKAKVSAIFNKSRSYGPKWAQSEI